MGVKGLFTFMEKNKLFLSDVKIKELIDKEDAQKPPVIIVDILCCISHIHKMFNISWIGGGQLKEACEAICRLLSQLHNLGAEIVVFADGQCIPSKEEEWKTRRETNQKDIRNLFEELHNDQYCLKKLYFFRPLNFLDAFEAVVKNVECKYFRSILECDFEIARYAELNHCFAILSQDSDFFIYEGAKYILSMEHFDLKKMTTRVYDRNLLADFLGLNPRELSWFASLAGNDIVDKKNLVRFHYKIRQPNDPLGHNFKSIAGVIKKYRNNLEGLLYRYFHFGAAKSIKESINSYDVKYPHTAVENVEVVADENWREIQEFSKELHISNKIISWVYPIIFSSFFLSGNAMEDYDRNHFKPLCQKLLKKIYGILLYEKPLPENGKHQVRQLMVSGPDSLNSSQLVDAIHPVKHSGLLALWGANKNLEDERFELFFWALDMDNRFKLNDDRHLIIPLTSLKYLMDEGWILDDWEIKALVSSWVLLDFYSVENLKKLRDFPLGRRQVSLYSSFSKCLSIVYFLNHACGHPIDAQSENPIRYNDGKLFQDKYRTLKSSKSTSVDRLCENKPICIQQFNKIMQLLRE